MKPQVAIAVVSWNTRALLAACLRSMQADVEAGRAEVWVVDNGSSDGSPDLVRDEFPWVRLLVPDRNLGFGPAVNLVARQTDTAWIAPSNADIELTPGALGTLLRSGDEDPGAGAIAPRLLLPGGALQYSIHPFPTLRTAALSNLFLYRLSRAVGEELCLPGYWDVDRPRRAGWAMGAFLVVRREAWDAAGGFDDDQWMYAEDINLAWKLKKRGWGVRYEPRAVVHHVHSAALSQAFGDAWVGRAASATYAWIATTRGLPAAWSVAAANLAGLGFRYGLFKALDRVRPGRFADEVEASRRGIAMHRVGLRSRDALLRTR